MKDARSGMVTKAATLDAPFVELNVDTRIPEATQGDYHKGEKRGGKVRRSTAYFREYEPVWRLQA